jgi:hypothetical protein
VAERALVGEAQVRAAVGEREAGADVRREGTVRVADRELAAHPQVGEERFGVVQGEPEVLAAPFGAKERAADHRGGEPVGAGDVSAHRPRVEDLGSRDRATHDVAFNPGADGLDLRQFRHRRPPIGAGTPYGCRMNAPLTPL